MPATEGLREKLVNCRTGVVPQHVGREGLPLVELHDLQTSSLGELDGSQLDAAPLRGVTADRPCRTCPNKSLAIEEPAAHWAEHDRRLVRYWRSRTPAERLAQAAAYRVRVHGETADPDEWTWRFVPPDAE